jgi:hypothetical protein
MKPLKTLLIVCNLIVLCCVLSWHLIPSRKRHRRIVLPQARPYVPVCVVHAQRPGGISYLPLLIQSMPNHELFVVSVDGKCGDTICHNLTRFSKHYAECHDTQHIECVVQQAAYDVMSAIKTCAGHYSENDWLLVLEDDVSACGNTTIEEVQQILMKESVNKTAVYFFSIANTAFAINTHVIDAYANAVMTHLTTTPFDIVLWGKDWMPRGMRRKKHTHTLFRHNGRVSNMPFRNTDEYINTYNQEGGLRFKACGSEF